MEKFTHIDPTVLDPIVSGDPIWYQHPMVIPLIAPFTGDNLGQTPAEREKVNEVLRFFSDRLRAGGVITQRLPEYFNDDDRVLPPKTVVIHHTATSPHISEDDLNALHMLRLYVPVFGTPYFFADGHPQALSSGHYREDGSQTFIGYHYLVRQDGSVSPVLKDKHTGFHAGSYRVNCESVGISIVGDLTEEYPSIGALQSVADIIGQYPYIQSIIGHREVVGPTGPVQTTCPGNLFLGAEGWKQTLLDLVR